MAYETGPGAHGTPNVKVPNTFSPEKHKTHTNLTPVPNITPTTNEPLGGASPVQGASGLTYAQLMGLGDVMQSGDAALQASLDAIAANANAQAAGAGAGLADIGNQKDQLRHQLQTGLRDNEQAIDAGMEAAANDALQRGIYDSGITTENKETVAREGAEAEADMRAQFKFAMTSLNNRAAAIQQQIAAIRQMSSAAQAQQRIQHNLSQDQYLQSVLMQYNVSYEDIVAAIQGGQIRPGVGSGSGGARYQ